MPIYTNKGKYLLVEADEPYSLNLFFTMIDEVARRCVQENLKKVLVDITAMEGSPSIIDRYETGVKIAEVWGSKIRAAGVARKSMINFLVETVAVNRGADFKVFSDMDLAMQWLEPS